MVVVKRIFAVITFAAVATGSAAAAGGSKNQTQGNFPVPESRPLLIDQLHTVAGMGLMTGSARPSLAPVGHMEIVEVLFAIAKGCINGGVRKAQKVRFMAGKAKSISSLAIGSVKGCRISAGQQTKVI